jgi:RNA polymerase sigma-70 factor (ECF subfamily)
MGRDATGTGTGTGAGNGTEADADVHALVAAALTGPAARGTLLETAALARARRDRALDVVLDDLAGRAAAGDDAAVELLLDVVHRLALARPAISSVILDAALVDDVTQATLVTVERRIGSYEGRAKFRTWLHTVARNEALMAVRRRQAEPVAEPPGASARFSSVVAGRLTIEALVDGLPEPYRQTLRLQLFDNLDYDAIAGRLEVPVGTVRSRLAKARELLRVALGNRTV